MLLRSPPASRLLASRPWLALPPPPPGLSRSAISSADGAGAGAGAGPVTEEDPFSPRALLSAENRASVVGRMRKATPMRLDPEKATRTAAVLVPICVDRDGEVCLAYQLRARSLSSHAGQVCFPGGASDQLEGSDRGDKEEPTQTATRETEEELGIAAKDIDIWGEMPPVGSKSGDTIVIPVVGEIMRPRPLIADRHFRLSPHEVEEAFLVPVRQLAASGRYTQFRVPGTPGYSLPVFNVEPHRVWGMTAIITFSFLRALLPRVNYKHKLNFQSPLFIW